MPTRHIVVIGSLNLDRTFRVDALPRPGATQTVLDYAEGVGGKGANQAAAAAAMGARTYMLGCLGHDAAGDTIAAELAGAGVDTSTLVRTHEAPSGTAAILLTPEGENSILVVPGANHALTPQHLRDQHQLLTSAAMLLLQMETPLAVLAEALVIAGPAGVPVMLDPAPAAPSPPTCSPSSPGLHPTKVKRAFTSSRPAATRHRQQRSSSLPVSGLLSRSPGGPSLRLRSRRRAKRSAATSSRSAQATFWSNSAPRALPCLPAQGSSSAYPRHSLPSSTQPAPGTPSTALSPPSWPGVPRRQTRFALPLLQLL